jgi:hypothetical protein
MGAAWNAIKVIGRKRTKNSSELKFKDGAPESDQQVILHYEKRSAPPTRPHACHGAVAIDVLSHAALYRASRVTGQATRSNRKSMLMVGVCQN